jgi:hypothetical protein
MAIDLETTKTEVQAEIERSSLAVFYGYSSLNDSVGVYWDTERYPDFRDFLRTAEKAGVKLIVFHHQQFSMHEIDELLQDLEETELSREEKRSFQNRIAELQKYEGFTCLVELSFSLENRVYCYQLQADWYRAWEDLLSEIDAVTDEEEEDEGPIAGYFSNN